LAANKASNASTVESTRSSFTRNLVFWTVVIMLNVN
jgi:hypothetical protein